jgi:hypothetical protein
MIGADRVKATRWEATATEAAMNSKDQCTACGGGGLVPAPDCACDGNAHTCTAVVCTMCNGTGHPAQPSD